MRFTKEMGVSEIGNFALLRITACSERYINPVFVIPCSSNTSTQENEYLRNPLVASVQSNLRILGINLLSNDEKSFRENGHPIILLSGRYLLPILKSESSLLKIWIISCGRCDPSESASRTYLRFVKVSAAIFIPLKTADPRPLLELENEKITLQFDSSNISEISFEMIFSNSAPVSSQIMTASELSNCGTIALSRIFTLSNSL